MPASITPTTHRARRHISRLFLPGVLCAASVHAHDFWLQPDAFRIDPQAPTSYSLQVGHGAQRQASPIPPNRITRFDALAPDGTVLDLRRTLHGSGDARNDALFFASPGVYILSLETDDRAQSHLPAIRFNDYLKAEGLTPAMDYRMSTHRMDANGAEKYSRRAKAIVQVRGAEAGQANITRPLGLTLEIVPKVNPYARPQPPVLPVQVIYQGRALAGALVKLTNLEHDEVPFETASTDQAGQANFTMPNTGQWLLNVIWTQPVPDSSEVDFDTVFSSLSFGFP